MEAQVNEYIICSAIHFDDDKKHVHQPKNITSGFVVAGRRHHNCYTTLQSIGKSLGYEDEEVVRKGLPLANREVQGFITNTDRFVDRKEGWAIAVKAGQVKDRQWDDNLNIEGLEIPKNTKMILISEDLY